MALLLPLLAAPAAATSENAFAPPAPPFCAFEDALFPPYYVAYKAEPGSISVDGKLNEAAWEEVAWTTPNRDICGPSSCSHGPPRFDTRQKVRWDDEFLYVAAFLEEPQVWANNTKHNSVIFADNDYEVFINPDGSTHNYKEFEVNARGAWWDLALNAPYENGGYENSSRVGATACCWDDPQARVATSVVGCTLNDPATGPCSGWIAEMAFPLAAISLNNTNKLPPPEGSYWRINFSRVEWRVHEAPGAGGHERYALDGPSNCTWPSPHGCGPQNSGDNWVWAPTGMVDIHQPEYWGYVQFSSSAPNTTAVIKDPTWTLRSIAMQLYYAQIRFRGCKMTPTRGCTGGTGNYTTDLSVLRQLAPKGPQAFDGTCTREPAVRLTDGGRGYEATVIALDGRSAATIDQTRRLLIHATMSADAPTGIIV